MPEYNNIQTFEESNTKNIKTVFGKYSNFLNVVGIENENIHNELKNIQIEFEDDFPYAYFRSEPQLTKFSEIPVIPYVMTYKIDLKIYVVCELLIETELIKNSETNYQYSPKVLPFIKNICREMEKIFPKNGIYFTDEVQDLNHIEKIWEDKNNEFYDFDFALLPQKVAENSNEYCDKSKFS